MAIVMLSEEVVARIAAGEAVERPASVVKELIENSIDAGASVIHTVTSGGGRRLIRVSDNGSGIPSAEVELAFMRHATSKLRVAQDLRGLVTLGFRGEALASIAAVSQTAVVTRRRGEGMGVSLKLHGGAVQHHQAIGAPAGTVVTIENLFFNTPARLAFLKSAATEKRHIQRVVTRYALAYPDISFVLKQDGREPFRSSGRGRLSDAVAQVFGLSDFKRMAAVSSEAAAGRGLSPIGVVGYVSQPGLHRPDRSRLILFINGRAIQDTALSHAIAQAYGDRLPSGQHPLAALLITLPPDDVDVNAHPTKAEVRFRDPSQVYAAVQRAVRRAVLDSDHQAPTKDVAITPPPQPTYQTSAGYDLDDDADLDWIPEAAGQPARPRTLPLLRIVGQIGAVYMIAEGPAGLYLIDQNAAHERILYDQIHAEMQQGRLQTTAPMDSPTLALSPDDSALLTEVDAVLAQLGFDIEGFGPQAFVFRRLPRRIVSRPLNEAFAQMLSHLRQSARELDDAIVALAAAAAVKNGQILQPEEMQSMVRQLERSPAPYQSPTGQTIMIHMTREHLAKAFRRGP